MATKKNNSGTKKDIVHVDNKYGLTPLPKYDDLMKKRKEKKTGK